MRIISGSLKGRSFDSPAGHRTHPMSEKARGAIFNILGDIEGLTLWDAFAGSGAIGFEAVSRGAKSVLLTDISKSAHTAMKRNVEVLNIENQVKVTRANASGWSDNNPSAKFNIIVCDPPHDDLQPAILAKLTRHIKNGGIYVLSVPPNADVELPGLELVASKDYGDLVLRFHKLK